MIWALHGAVGMAADWQPLAQAVAASGQVVRSVDLWRFLDCCPMSLEEFGRAFCEEVRAVDDEPVILGYSMGGRLALHALLEDPEMWKGAMIVSAHTGLAVDDEQGRFQRMVDDAEWAAAALSGEWKSFLNKWNSQNILAGAALTGRSQLELRRQAVARSFMDWTLSKQADLLDRLGEITCPVQWIVGERDEKFKAVGQTAVTYFQNGVLSEADSGHRVPWDQPEWFAEQVLGFSS